MFGRKRKNLFEGECEFETFVLVHLFLFFEMGEICLF